MPRKTARVPTEPPKKRKKFQGARKHAVHEERKQM